MIILLSFRLLHHHFLLFADDSPGTSAVANATVNDNGNATNVSTFPAKIPYCSFATASVVIFFNPLTTVIESMFLFTDDTIDVSDIGIDILNIDDIMLFVFSSLNSGFVVCISS